MPRGGPSSPQYENLGIGQQIGGPLQECTGPALNNFIKFVTVFAFMSEGIYDVKPDVREAWRGVLVILASIGMILFSQVGLTLIIDFVTSIMKRRAKMRAFEEGEEVDDDDED